MPTLRGRTFTETERDTVHAQLARVRATTDRIETAVETGDLTLEEGLAELLRGESGSGHARRCVWPGRFSGRRCLR
ncbi:hypothetical protein E1281_34620 [Actinomadura sp. KC345]|nr:hypothetical protein E1281_34620 [Actinomadura sp. KC345]